LSDIKIEMKDGTIREFKHEGRSGGSYTKHIKYEPGFIVIIDEWDHRISIPTADIKEISEKPIRW
jgi:hypothetical protein